jgi:WhiB family transcriptional regulator, redox-sensing transcriptional regulator
MANGAGWRSRSLGHAGGALTRRPSWQAQAACRGTGVDPYFPARGTSTEPAKSTCAVCSVREPCLAYALADPEIVGVWGATSAKERARMRQLGRCAT